MGRRPASRRSGRCSKTRRSSSWTASSPRSWNGSDRPRRTCGAAMRSWSDRWTMSEFARALRSFGNVYILAVVALGIVAYVASRFLSTDPFTLYQLFLVFLGTGYVFASVLSWTGFGNLYRYSPTLFIGSPSYRKTIAKGDIRKEGRDREALGVGILFGLALLGSGVALLGWLFAAAIVAMAVAVGYSLRLLVVP